MEKEIRGKSVTQVKYKAERNRCRESHIETGVIGTMRH